MICTNHLNSQEEKKIMFNFIPYGLKRLGLQYDFALIVNTCMFIFLNLGGLFCLNLINA